MYGRSSARSTAAIASLPKTMSLACAGTGVSWTIFVVSFMVSPHPNPLPAVRGEGGMSIGGSAGRLDHLRPLRILVGKVLRKNLARAADRDAAGFGHALLHLRS